MGSDLSSLTNSFIAPRGGSSGSPIGFLVFLLVAVGVVLFFVLFIVLFIKRASRAGGGFLQMGVPGQATIVQVGAASGLVGEWIQVTADVVARGAQAAPAPPMRIIANVRVGLLFRDQLVPGASFSCRYDPRNPTWLRLVIAGITTS